MTSEEIKTATREQLLARLKEIRLETIQIMRNVDKKVSEAKLVKIREDMNNGKH